MRDFFPMYCSLDAISGFHEEKERAVQLLDKHLPSQPGIVILPLENEDWIYGQATFPRPGTQGAPFKFLDRFSTITTNGVLDILVGEGRPVAILFVDAKAKVRFESHAAFGRVRPLFRLIADFRAPAPRKGFLGGLKDAITGRNAVTPEEPVDPIAVAHEAMDLFAHRVREQDGLIEILQNGIPLYHYCALDTFLDALQARAKARPTDVAGQTALAMLLSDFGDHAASLPQARLATALAGVPPEAWLWRAKAAWWAEQWDEGLEAFAEIGEPPDHWTIEFRCHAEALRSALLDGSGDTEGAIGALEAALELQGNSVALHLCLARLQSEAGRPAESVTTLRQARVIAPEEALVQVELCRALEMLGDDAALVKALRKLAESERGRVELRRFERSRDIEGAKTPLPMIFDDFDLHRRQSVIAATLPDWLLLVSDSALFVFFNAYLAHEHRAETEHAAKLSFGFRRLMQEPLSGAAHVSLAASWSLSGRRDIAVQWARNCVAFGPDQERHHWMLTNMLKELGDYDDAFAAGDFAMMVGKADEDELQLVHDLLWSIPRLDRIALWAEQGADSPTPLRAVAEEHLDQPEFRPGALFAISFTMLPDDYDSALGLQREALSLQPDNDVLHEYHIATLIEAGAVESLAVARLARGAALSRRFPTLDAGDFAGVVGRLVASEQIEKAQSFAHAALYLDPLLPATKVARAVVALAEERIDEATADLIAVAYSEDALAGSAADTLAAALSGADRSEEALPHWARLRALLPANARGYLGAANDLWLLDRDAEALPMVEQAIERDAGDAGAWNLYGCLLKDIDRREEAVTAFARALTCSAPPARTRLHWARLLVAMDRSDEALAGCDAALLADPNDTAAAIGRIVALGEKGLAASALQAALDWIASAGSDAKQALEVQQALYDHSGAAAAVQFGEKSLERYPGDPALLADHAFNLVDQGRFDEAMPFAEMAVAAEPESDVVWRQCAYVYGWCDQLGPAAATALAERLLSRKRDAKALRYAANLRRAANLDASDFFAQARDAYLEMTDPDDSMVAWCMLNLGDFAAAAERLARHLVSAPDDEAALLDGAIIRFLASDGDHKEHEILTTALRKGKAAARGEINLAFAARVAKQWRRQGAIAPSSRLEALDAALRAATCEP